MVTLLSSEKLQAEMRRKGITQERLAELIGYSDRNVRNWLSKDTNVCVSGLYALAAVFGIAVNDLVVSRPALDKE